MATMTVKNATGGTETIEKPLAPARALAAASRPVVLSTEDLAAINAITAAITTLDGRVDGLETLIGATNTALASLVSQTDTLETLIAATNAALSTIDGRVDGLETLITATNAALAAAIPAGTNVIGKVGLDQNANGVSQNSDAVYVAGVAVTPKFAVIAASSSGDNQIVAAVTSKKIRVLAYNMVANGAVNAKFQSDATDKTGLKYFDAAGAGICAPFNPVGWFETVAGEKLDLNLSGAVAVGGELVYIEV